MIICNEPEQIIYERVKNIIREDMNASDLKAGDIAAVIGPKNIQTGDTITSINHNILLAI